jgi:hypothetical protein
MSTDHFDPNATYGPTPPGAKYEHTDIDPGIGYRFAGWLAVSVVLGGAIVYGTFWFFEGNERATQSAAQTFPLAASRPTEPPAPRLQTQPFKDIYLLRLGENEKLGSYGWVDKQNGIVHLPIDRAMELTLQQGLPARATVPDGMNTVVEDSSAGRTRTGR